MPRNDKTFLALHKHLLSLEYSKEWKEYSDNKYINEILNHASKKENGKNGLPDYIYVNENKQILIMIELKTNISQHEKEAIPQIKHYINCFKKGKLSEFGIYNQKIDDAIEYLKTWNILGIAVSGNVLTEYAYLIDTFYLKIDGEIVNLNIKEIHNEEEYCALFQNVDLEEISTRITKSSSWINNLLYDVKEDKRPTLLSILLISLYPNSKKIKNYFIDDFKKYTPKEIMDNISITIPKILGPEGENIPQEKIDMIMREFKTFENEKVLNETETIKTILTELKYNVIPLFQTKHNYDIIGKFYQEFLRYAGIVDVQSGIVLTPEHVTELFTNLIDLKKNDVILDSCCGTGSFLIAGMNKLLELQNTEKEKEHVKQKQLIGNELKSHMYILAISNMLFRGDGKSNIFNYDFFSKDFDDALEEKIKETGCPSIGFINPPYSGSFTKYDELNEFKSRDSSKNKSKNKKPWMKEISFLEKMCRICSRYVVMIAPPQTFMGETEIRNRILENNTLRAVITMPKDLFQPNASTGSAIIVIETNKKHDFNHEVVFYNLQSDGFELAKKKGRRDIYDKWNGIKKKMLRDIDAPYYNNPQNINSINHCYNKIKKDDEWLIQAFSKVDFSKVAVEDFEKSIKEYVIFKNKLALDIIDKNIEEAELLTLFYNISNDSVIKPKLKYEKQKLKLFSVKSLFDIRGVKKKVTQSDTVMGEYLYITTSNKNNGVSGFHNEYCEEENTFTVDSATDGKSFFHQYKFIGSDHVEILAPYEFAKEDKKDIIDKKGKKIKVKENINIYTAIYLQTLLNFYLDKYEYSRKRAQIRIKKEEILLPIDDDENIDWTFMENYIKSLPYSIGL